MDLSGDNLINSASVFAFKSNDHEDIVHFC